MMISKYELSEYEIMEAIAQYVAREHPAHGDFGDFTVKVTLGVDDVFDAMDRKLGVKYRSTAEIFPKQGKDK